MSNSPNGTHRVRLRIAFVGAIAVVVGFAVWRLANPTNQTSPDGAQATEIQSPPSQFPYTTALPLSPSGEYDPTAITDPHVAPASAFVPTVLAGAAVANNNSFTIQEVSQIVSGTTYKWMPRPGEAVRLVATDQRVTISGDGAVANEIKEVSVDGNTRAFSLASFAAPKTWAVSFSLTSQGVQHRVRVTTAAGDDDEISSNTITLITPTGDDLQLRQPIISKLSNNSFAEPVDIKDGVRVYEGYLKLTGQQVLPGTQLQFAVFKETGEFLGLTNPSRPISPNADGTWEAEIDMELRGMVPPDNGFLLAMSSSANGSLYRFSQTSKVDFEVASTKTKMNIAGAPVLRESDDSGHLTFNDIYKAFLTRDRTFIVKGTVEGSDQKLLEDSRVVIYLNNSRQDVKDIDIKKDNNNEWQARITVDADIEQIAYSVQAATVLGRDAYGTQSAATQLRVRTTGPKVVAVNQTNAALEGIRVVFDEPIVVPDAAKLNAAFQLRDSKNELVDAVINPMPKLDASDNSLTLVYSDVPPDMYTFTIEAVEIQDFFGNQMEKDHEEKLFRAIGAEEPIISRGITGPTGPHVEFPEYTDPRPIIDGFNPSDHVETRVSRLYYYRNAHRVAQIINREVKSYNQAAVKMQEQLADKARQIADQATNDRQSKERRAVDAAQRTREAERELQEAEANAQQAVAQAANAAADLRRRELALRDPRSADQRDQLQAEVNDLRNVIGRLEQVAAAARASAQSAFNKVQALREQESQTREHWQQSIAVEDRAREEQFRREVAAARADPDTYAPGKPGSEDPVRQVSVSVIGEGVIHLRGPIKGINIIRTMINQIDSPVGQVRVGVHTVQINGEHGDRMEKVAEKIQRYIDHSRFLTMQSAEMLRRAIVQVAAQKAYEVGPMPGATQEERDRRYLYAFFGEDFIHELEVMDSEFLMTGNKLLSIHSMDSTSLASAMFIMALAKNSTRLQILAEFERMMAADLPMAEQNYFESGVTCDGKKELFGKHCKKEDFQLLSQNALFQSIRGFFNAEIAADHTMTPIQREFVRLAQIFKSRLIVEMELKQRIMERAVIEERLGDRKAELLEARQKEREAQNKLEETQASLTNARKAAIVATQHLSVALIDAKKAATEVTQQADRSLKLVQKILDSAIPKRIANAAKNTAQELREVHNKRNVAEELEQFVAAARAELLLPLDPKKNERFGDRILDYVFELDKNLTETRNKHILPKDRQDPLPNRDPLNFRVGTNVEITVSETGDVIVSPPDAYDDVLEKTVAEANQISTILNRFSFDAPQEKAFQAKLKLADEMLTVIKSRTRDDTLDSLHRAMTMFDAYLVVANYLANEKMGALIGEMNQIVVSLGSDGVRLETVYQRWLSIQRQVLDSAMLGSTPSALQSMLESKVEYDFALRQAEASRRPLDHKKFLDMLVDEMEDKYIELLEGTRAHTANIDGYIKRLMTALDDDFNTQFYYPTFRHVRRASQMYDVQLGQVETTTILANNRAFAKVSPQATMEFDLPQRSPLIVEAMDLSKAMMDDFGALAADPTFLAMSKLNAGQPTSSAYGATGGFSTVRNVLPGLSTDTAEAVMGQQGPGGSQLGSAIESLIPDPAIYKFETGTGFEIRPVIQPDGQAVVFDFNYMYTTNVREPVRADEKHLGRVKRHFVHTDVQLSNYELREVSRYTVALKASRTSRGVPLAEDIPIIGALFRPLPSDESSLQQNIILAQSTIFPTLFDLMGLRWAPVVADLDPLRLSNDEFIVRNRRRVLTNRVFDHSSHEVDKFLRIPEGERRMDLYRSQETIPSYHPNGYQGPGANLRDSQLREGYDPTDRPVTPFAPGSSSEGSLNRPQSQSPTLQPPLRQVPPGTPHSSSRRSPSPIYDHAVQPASYPQPAPFRLPERRYPRQPPAAGRDGNNWQPTITRLPPID